jgi:ankyrin repeat protein
MIHYQKVDDINTVNVPELNGKTPLFGAILAREQGCVNALLNFGALPNITDNDGVFPLLLAVVEPCDDMTDLLLEKGADPNQSQLSTGTRPVHNASRLGNTDVLHLLIRYNADLDAVDINGKNAMTFASSNGHTEIVEILINHGAIITIAAINAARENGHFRLADYIAEKGGIPPRTPE